MDQEQAVPEGSRKPFFSDMTCTVKLGATAHHFEMWHHRHPVHPVMAIWRNEVGPADSTRAKVML